MAYPRTAIVIGSALPPGVSAAEDKLFNTAGLVAAPGLAAWAANAGNTGFKDRLTRGAEFLANGQNPVTGRFFAGPGGENAYSLQAANMAILLPSFDMSGDMTIGMRFSPATVSGAALGGLAFGSYSGATNSWWINTDVSNGKMRFAFGAISSAYADYTGDVLAAGAWRYAVLSLSRTLGRARLRVDGTYEQILDNTGLKTVTLLNELAIGLQNATGTAQERRGYYRKCAAFNRYLTGADLTNLEAYLASSVGD